MVKNQKKVLSEYKTRHDFWKNDEIKILTDLWMQDVPAKYISRILKRSPNAIEVKAMRVGLKPRRTERALVQSAKENKARMRRCMSCNILFYSTHIGNRICTQCKEHPIWMSGNDLQVNLADIEN